MPVIGVAVLIVIVPPDGGPGSDPTVTAAVAKMPVPGLVAVTVALPTDVPAVNRALAADRKRRTEERTLSDLRVLFESLTPREREVLVLVTAGLVNKRVAAELGVSEITVKVHRSHVMRKMRTRSLAHLVRIADTLGIRRDKPQRT